MQPVANSTNPFRQAEAYWQLCFIVDKSAVDALEDAFGDMALATSSFEVEEDKPEWKVEILTEERPSEKEMTSRLAVLETLGHKVKLPAVTRCEQKDWVSEVQKSFPPLSVGRYFVHGSHYEGKIPPASIALQVDAGAAFGSGEHATTSSCLKAMGMLARKRSFRKLLDMGCGSGILALAAAKTQPCRILAVDIDHVAVRVTRENLKTNQAMRVKAYMSDGYRSRVVKCSGKYDVIFSNILARPLVAFAPLLRRHLAKNGVAVLSGLLASQERMVLAAHRAQGLYLKKRLPMGGWNTLIIGR